MKRRELLILGAGAVLAPRLALAKSRVPRVGYLLLPPLSEPPSRERQAFLDGLRDHGYVPGKNIELVYRSAENEPEFLEAQCQELVRQKVDLIATSGAAGTIAARNTTRTIPIVFLAVGDPVGIGIVASLARPGENVTGVSFSSSDLAGKRIELIRAIVPAAKRVAFLWEERNRNAQIEAQAAIAAARRIGMLPEPLPLATHADLTTVMQRIAARKPDALYVTFATGIVADNRSAIAEFALRHRLPLMSGWGFMTDAGGLLSYAPDIPLIFRRGAYYVDRILKGTRASELPVEQPTRVELAVNLKTAKAIGLTIPRTLLLRADRVIE